VRIGGEGTPLVAAGVVEEFAAALGITTLSGLNLLADALDLAFRLPATWRRMEALEVQPWKGRRLAALTRDLPGVAAAWVDAELAGRLDKVGLPTLEKTVAQAIAVFCPELLPEAEKRGRDGWRVDLEHHRGTDGLWTGSSFLDAVGDTADLTALHDLARTVAENLRKAGDPDPLDQRKAKALGLIGRNQHDDPTAIARVAAEAAARAAAAADEPGHDEDGAGPADEASSEAECDQPLGDEPVGVETAGGEAGPADHAAGDRATGDRAGDDRAGGDQEPSPGPPATTAPPATADAGATEPTSTPAPTRTPERRRPGQPTRLYLHITAADLATHPDPQAGGFGRVERLGPATLDLLKGWLGHDRFTLTPVLDLTRTDAVDQHHPPAWMRELVVLRDQHCAFPWCATDARACDLDHIVPYDEDGPPGQTHPENLAPLCRRHHPAKTFFRWRYQRNRDGTHHWTSPRGRRFLVIPDVGTIPLDRR
jgi:hypothetical protein